MAEKYSVYTQKVKVPIYHVFFDVYVGYDMNDIKQHAEDIFPGLQLTELNTSTTQGFTYLLKHYELGNHLSVLFSLNGLDFEDAPSLDCTIVHEAVHLSWYILESVGIKVTAENHEAQAYLVEFLVKKIKEVIKKAKFNLNENNLDKL